jgi:hypothetical protein
MSSDYVNKKKDNYVKVIDSSNDFEMLATSIFVYFNINGKRSHLPLNELIKQFSNLKKTRGINEKSKTKRNI